MLTKEEISLSPYRSITLLLKKSLSLVRENSPLLAARLIQYTADFIIAVWMSRINSLSLSASNLSATAQAFLRSVSVVLLYFTSTMVSGAKKEKEYDKISCTLRASVIFALIISIPTTLSALFFAQFFKLTGQSSNDTALLQDFFRGYAPGIPFMLLAASCQQTSLGLISSSTTLYSMLISRGFLLGLGFYITRADLDQHSSYKGFGYAYSISNFVYLIAFIMQFRLFKKFKEWTMSDGTWEMTISIFKTLVKKGIPLGVYAFVELGSLLLNLIFIGRLGDYFLSASQAGTQVASFLANITFAIGSTVNVIVRRESVSHLRESRYTTISGVIMCVLIPLLTGIVALLPGNILIKPFINTKESTDHEMIHDAKNYLLLNILAQVFDGMRNVAIGALQGHGNTNATMVTSILSMLFINLPLACLFTFIPFFEDMKGQFNSTLGILSARTLAIFCAAFALLYMYINETRKAAQSSIPTEATPLVANINTPEQGNSTWWCSNWFKKSPRQLEAPAETSSMSAGFARGFFNRCLA